MQEERRQAGVPQSEARQMGVVKAEERQAGVPKAEARQENVPQAAAQQADIDAVVAFLDGYTQAGESRIKVDVVDGEGRMLSHQYHHGRCDVGSPWARGEAFDVLE